MGPASAFLAFRSANLGFNCEMCKFCVIFLLFFVCVTFSGIIFVIFCLKEFCMSFLVFYGEAEMVTAGEMCGKEYFMLRDVALKHRRF